ncbi:MAG: AtpZ/AtpI family protein [Pyrinomonadaceae bacterium]|nr:AtpZ/AtpI family protein [Pyrinomonadaceae bacterium]
MVQSIFDTQDEKNSDDPWLSEFSAIDPSIAPDRPEPGPEVLPTPAIAQPPTHFDPYGDEPFDGFETVVVPDPWLPEPPDAAAQFEPLPYEPESAAETARRSGLAWSLGIMFFCSVAFMLLLGWGADLVLGTAPWGLVGGIVLGSLIGFIQFFRLSSRLYSDSKTSTEVKPLLWQPDDDDEHQRRL